MKTIYDSLVFLLADDCRRLAAVAFLTIFAVLGWQMLAKLQEQQQRHDELWGPNPARVQYETSLGGSGTVLIRDKNHAEQEVRAHIKSIWDDLRANPKFEIKGNPDEYTFTKFVVE